MVKLIHKLENGGKCLVFLNHYDYICLVFLNLIDETTC